MLTILIQRSSNWQANGATSQEGFELAGDGQIDDVLTYALFPQVGSSFSNIK